jgi:rhodanese-related sulfurtransferase
LPTGIDREEVRRLVADGAQLVDVLPVQEYEEFHLVGAVNVPLRELDARAPLELDRGRAVVVYCNDYF